MSIRSLVRSARGRLGLAPVVLATGAALVVPVLGAGAAAADTPATLSDVRVTESQLTATVVLRSDSGSVNVDPSSIKVSLGGQDAKTDVQPADGRSRSTMLVIDTSGSMEASGMTTVRTAVKQFLEVVPDDVKVGVVSFASTSGVDVAPTTDHAKVLAAVGALRSEGETALYQAIQDAVTGLGTEGERSIVLLSDGGDTVARRDGGEGASDRARQAALTSLAKSRVRAEVISFKNEKTNTAVLEEFAEVGGGRVTAASNTEAVSGAFAAAARALNSQFAVTVERPTGVTGPQDVIVTGTASGEPFEARQFIDLGDLSPVVAEGESTAALGPSEGITALSPALLIPALLVVFVGIFGLSLAIGGPSFKSRRTTRIEAVEAYGFGRSAGAKKQQTSPTAISEQLVHMGDQFMEGRESTTKTMALLTRADLPWRAGEWLVLRIVSVVVAAAAGYLLLNPAPVVGLIVGVVVGIGLPPLALRFIAHRRTRKFEAILPDVMMLVATSLASGFSLLQALDAVAKDAAEPAAKEFSRALAEARIGSDVSDSLEHMATRMDSDNMRWTTMAIRIQREVGGNLAETLRTTAATLREREMLRRQVRALSAEGRLSGYILVALPFGLFLYMMWVNYDYISLLWTNVLGLIMAGFGLVSLVIGIFWMRNVVKIEV